MIKTNSLSIFIISHYSYFTTSDFTLAGIILHEVEEAITKAEWTTDANGVEYFVTENSIGCDGKNGDKPGTFLMIHTGGGKLQGRVSSKVYAIMLAICKWNASKKPVGNAFVNIKDVDPDKSLFFSEVYQRFFEKNIWTYNDCKANEYLLKLGNAVFKFIDITSNITKSYCYYPSDKFKNSLRKGIIGMQTTEDKLEIAPHYEASKKNFKTGVTFCSECGETSCVLNRAMCIIIAETTDLIQEIRDVPEERKIKFTLTDFFRRDELEHFIHNFTIPCEHISEANTKIEWMELDTSWPRKLKNGINLDVPALRWDIKKATTYRDGIWNGIYQKWMFEIIASDESRIPDDFLSLISHVNVNVEDSIFVMDSMVETLVEFSEGESTMEVPFDDPDVDPKWNKWAETKLDDANWRDEAKSALKKLIEGTNEFNQMFKGKIQERQVDHHWYTLLRKIEEAERTAGPRELGNFGAYEGYAEVGSRDVRLANAEKLERLVKKEALQEIVQQDTCPGLRIKY